MKKFICLFVLLKLAFLASAQIDSIIYSHDTFFPSFVSLEVGDSASRLNLRKLRRTLSAEQVLKKQLQLDSSHMSVAIVDTILDETNNKHILFKQLYRGIEIDGTRYCVHYSGKDAECLNGDFRYIENCPTNPSISETVAFGIATNYVNATEYLWENDSMKTLMREFIEDTTLLNRPYGILVIMFDSVDKPHLTYKYGVYTTSPQERYVDIFVDATDGSIVDEENKIDYANAATRYYGNQQIVTQYRKIKKKYRLRDYTRGNGIITRNMNGKLVTGGAVDYYDSDDNWTAEEFHNSSNDDAGLTAHWAAEKTYDYFRIKFGRKSWNNLNWSIKTFVNADLVRSYPMQFSSNNNAFWNTLWITCGKGENNNPYVSVDIIAHEFGHGVTGYTAMLRSKGESGALNEGYSDIWGACVMQYALPNRGDSIWYHGVDVNKSNYRNIKNPLSHGNPDTYKGKKWIDASNVKKGNDYGGVHVNSTVLSHWFYLLSEGGQGENDNNDKYDVQGIGIDSAAQIAYRTLKIYLKRFSNFMDMRNYSIKAAQDLYGVESQAAISTQNAWYAVGIGTPYLEIVGKNDICDENYEYSVKNCPHDVTIRWTILNGLIIVDSTATTVTVKQKGPYRIRKGYVTILRPAFTGTAQLKAEFIKGGSVLSSGRKCIELHANSIPELERDTLIPLYTTLSQSFSIQNYSDEDSLILHWTIIKPNGVKENLGYGITKTYKGTLSGAYQIIVTNVDGCEPNNTTQLTFVLRRRVRRLVYKNPVSYSVDISIIEQNEGDALINISSDSQPYNGSYTLQLWNEYGMVRSVDGNTSTLQLSLSGLTSGTYFLKLVIEGELVTTQQLLIR